MQLKRFFQLVFVILFFGLSLPNELFPMGSWIIGVVSLVPLFFFIDHLPEGFGQTIGWGALWGWGFTFFHYFWLSKFGEFSLWTLGGVGFVYSLYGSLYFSILKFSFSASPIFRPFALSGVVLGFDFLRSIGYLSFPWNLTIHGFHDFIAFQQITYITGIFFPGFILIFFQSSLYFFFKKPKEYRNHIISVSINFSALILFGFIRLTLAPQESQTYLDIVVVQQNQDSWNPGAGLVALERLQELSLEGLEKIPINLGGPDFSEIPYKADLIIWSETSLSFLPQTIADNAFAIPRAFPFQSFLKIIDTPLLTGAPLPSTNIPNGLMNGAIIMDLDENNLVRLGESYGKQRLVPFAEHVPIQDIPFLERFLEEQIGIGAAGFQIGPTPSPIQISSQQGKLSAGIPICFEDSFFQQTRLLALEGADLFINLTNNSWSGTNSAQTQHLVASRFRTIETQRTLIRSTNSGVTAVIDPWGRILYKAPGFTEYSQSIRVPLFLESTQGYTPYTILGDWFPVMILYFVYLWIVFVGLKSRSKKNRQLPVL